MHVNPILINVREAIEAHPSGVSEYALLVALQENEAMQFNDIDPNLVLFRKHFLLMNALYQIQEIFCLLQIFYCIWIFIVNWCRVAWYIV